MAGFGRSPFGIGPFGRSDVGNDLIVELFPSEYLDPDLIPADGSPPSQNDEDPLVQVLKTYGNSVQKRRLEIEKMPDLIDYDKAPLEIVRQWGDMLGLGIDKNDPDFLQRSFLGNASQWLQLKASIKGYQVRGLASGFTVAVEPFWRIDPIWAPFIPARNKYLIKPLHNADPNIVKTLHTDSPPGTHVGTPTSEIYTYAKSSYLRITFEIAEPRRDEVNYNALLDLVIDKIRDVVAIHQELFQVVFQIRMSVDASNMTANMMIDEHANWNANVQSLFDIDAADIHPTDDYHLTVDIIKLDDSGLMNVSVTTSVDITVEDSGDVPFDVSVSPSSSMLIEEETGIDAWENTVFDVEPGDLDPLDSSPISVSMSIIITP